MAESRWRKADGEIFLDTKDELNNEIPASGLLPTVSSASGLVPTSDCILPTASSLPLFSLFCGAIAIGTAPIFVRLSTEITPTATAFWRLFLAQPILWLWFNQARKKNQISPEKYPLNIVQARPLFWCGVFFAADLWVWHWSIKLTSVANSTLLGNLAPLWVALVCWILWREKIERRFFFGMVVALGGLFLLLQHSAAPTKTGGEMPLLGNVLGILTAALYGSYQLSVSRLGRRFAPPAIMAWSGAVSSAVLLIIAVLSGGNLFPATMNGWFVLFALALFTHAAGQSLIAYGLGNLPATFGSLGLLVQPVSAAFLAWLILGEEIGIAQIAGGALVLSGIALARRKA